MKYYCVNCKTFTGKLNYVRDKKLCKACCDKIKIGTKR
jgi:hypothetical protein